MRTIRPPCGKKAGEDSFHDVDPCGTDEYEDSKKSVMNPGKEKSASDHKK